MLLHHRDEPLVGRASAHGSDRDLASKLPVEIWHHILKIAITTRWLQVNFIPPPDNPALIKGFAEASPLFDRIAADVHPESVHFSNAVDFMADRNCMPSFTRHLSVDGLYSINNDMLHKMEEYQQLQSFSISGPLLKNINKVPFASNLVRLDCTVFESHETWFTLKIDMFKNLEELRLRSRETKDEVSPILRAFLGRLATSRNEVLFAEAILKIISPLSRLRLLSIRLALDSARPLVGMVNSHNSSLRHLIPSEGYQRHYSDCPMCTEAYDHGEVIRAENTATRILAEGMPSLRRVLWANAWMRQWADESGQRGINIIRGSNGLETSITLSRDDGQQSR